MILSTDLIDLFLLKPASHNWTVFKIPYKQSCSFSATFPKQWWSIDWPFGLAHVAPSVSQNHVAPAPPSYIINTPTRQLKNPPTTTYGDSSAISMAEDSIVDIVQDKRDTDTLYKSVFSYDSYDFYSDNTMSDANSDGSPIVSSKKLEQPRLTESNDSDDVPTSTLKKNCSYHNTQSDHKSLIALIFQLPHWRKRWINSNNLVNLYFHVSQHFESTRMMNNVEEGIEDDDDELFSESSLETEDKSDAK
jgi:hypothetical protein